MTPAICTGCGVERDYPARRGDRLDDMACVHCGARKLTRAGRRPSKAARFTRLRFHRDPESGAELGPDPRQTKLFD